MLGEPCHLALVWTAGPLHGHIRITASFLLCPAPFVVCQALFIVPLLILHTASSSLASITTISGPPATTTFQSSVFAPHMLSSQRVPRKLYSLLVQKASRIIGKKLPLHTSAPAAGSPSSACEEIVPVPKPRDFPSPHPGSWSPSPQEVCLAFSFAT